MGMWYSKAITRLPNVMGVKSKIPPKIVAADWSVLTKCLCNISKLSWLFVRPPCACYLYAFQMTNESKFCRRRLDRRAKVPRRYGERCVDCIGAYLVEAVWWSGAASPSLEKWGLWSFSVQRHIEMRFCNHGWSQRHSVRLDVILQDSNTERISHRPPPEYAKGGDGLTCPTAWPQPHWPLLGSAWTCHL